MKLNPDKCHLILSGKENRGINVGNVVMKNSQNEKLLGVLLNGKTTFGYQETTGVGTCSTIHESIKKKNI